MVWCVHHIVTLLMVTHCLPLREKTKVLWWLVSLQFLGTICVFHGKICKQNSQKFSLENFTLDVVSWRDYLSSLHRSFESPFLWSSGSILLFCVCALFVQHAVLECKTTSTRTRVSVSPDCVIKTRVVT
jgi:hypothetical protein